MKVSPSCRPDGRDLLPPSDRRTLFLDLESSTIPSLSLKRPGVDQLLRPAVASNYEVVIFTAGTRLYASSVIDWLDPNREFISHRLYQDACTIDAEDQYLKNLTVTGRRLDRSVVIDDSPTVYGDHSQNVIPVSPFYGDPKDVVLLKILWFFEFEKQFKDLRLAPPKVSCLHAFVALMMFFPTIAHSFLSFLGSIVAGSSCSRTGSHSPPCLLSIGCFIDLLDASSTFPSKTSKKEELPT
ncbi:CTD small phosphatase-like protein [Rhynchospora pubera]|uniref:Mitochondrial import inner membrane translocase subunit TIM50 n=1 Tax=Rhynchospora pubera TaxID=906938 RepID=A0AAV8HGP4_9POAL|nr:CTD small phosphatase-like protein [Rhynchospora pubera]